MKKMFPFLFTGFYLTAASVAFSQPGSLDLTFEGDGNVIASISGVDYSNAIALQSDGKLVVAGYAYTAFENDFAILRFNADGSPDNSFDSDGLLAADFGGYDQFASAVAVKSDGKIVAVGSTHNGLNNDIMVMCFNTNGTMDMGFDGDGIKIIDIGISNDFGRAVAIQPDGKIIIAGTTNDNSTIDFVVMRLNSDGTADNSFDSDGLVLTDIDGADDYARALAIQSDGKIIAAGNGFTGFDSDFVAARYNTDGSLDNSFNFDGKLFTDFGSLDDIGNDVAVHSDGTIFISGYSNNGMDDDFAVAKYTSAGMLDVTFDTDGRVTTDIETGPGVDEDRSYGCALFNDGKIILTGSASDNGPTSMTLVCYDTDGSLETSFDGDGIILNNVMNTTFSSGVVIQPDGKFVAAGNGDGFAGTDFVISRFNGPTCNINTDVLVTDLTLVADAFGYDYQWVDCDDDYAIIPGATNQTYNAPVAGTYAVILTDGTCTDTSDCYAVDDCNVNVGVTQTGFSLTADAAGLDYIWVDCDDSYSMVPFQSAQTFNVIDPGNYAVIITDGACSDTSACFLMDNSGLSENNGSLIGVYPNPTTGVFTVQLDPATTAISILITDITGKTVYSETNLNGTNFTLDLSNQPKGIYMLEVTNADSLERIKLVKE